MQYKDSYLPVDHDFTELLHDLIGKKANGKIHYFNPENKLDDALGPILSIELKGKEEYLQVGSQQIRLDKIITILGKPGPAYDEYDRYANACLACEDLGQF